VVTLPAAAPPRKRGRPRNLEPSQEYRDRLEDIVSVAAEVFTARGYEAGSLDDVAAELGLRKASLYYYVKKKSELLRLVFDRAISTALADVDAIAATPDPRERLVGLIRYQANMVVRHPSLFAVFFDQRAGLEADDLAEIAEKERQYVRQFRQAVEAAMKAKVIPRGDSGAMAHAILGMTSWAYKWFDPDRDSLGKFADTCVALVVGPRAR
jgi:AcrR family transcriptional regulator